jgi:hypothetical protein
MVRSTIPFMRDPSNNDGKYPNGASRPRAQAQGDFKLLPLGAAERLSARDRYARGAAARLSVLGTACPPQECLTLREVLQTFPDGTITHECWSVGGKWFRCRGGSASC